MEIKNMKKAILACGIVALCFSSCTTTTKTASSIVVDDYLKSKSLVDLDVKQERVSYTYVPRKSVRRGGKKNVINAAVIATLKANGGGDVLVEPQYEIRTRHGLFGKKIKSVTVTGYPASYENFRKATDNK